jgi:class 3 adenylate cyclase/predicted ATPase
MRFINVLARVTWLLLTEGTVSYRRIKREFDLDSDTLEDVRHELIQVKQCAVDRDGEYLVWATTEQHLSLPSPVSRLAPFEPLTPVRETAPATQVRNLAPATSPAETTPTAELSTAPVPSSDGERRPLTVMFCDMADSTALSTRLDPEDLQDVIRAYQETCTGIIQQYEGFVARYMGDGILVYFGYPKSLERNAERAVRSALAIVEMISRVRDTLAHGQDVEVAVRIGISTGMVVVGEVVGEGLAQERTVVGEAPNIAARLQSLAGRNGIVIGSLTKELCGEAFVYQDLGPRELKGISGLVRTWGVLGLREDAADEADRDESGGAVAVPQLVGRDEEIGLLRRAWQSTKEEGRGQVVTISGEAGIGKSVLIDGLRAEVRAEDLPSVVLRCSPYHTNSALHPVIEYFKRLAGWRPEDTAEARLAKLEAALEGFDQPISETVPLFAPLLSLPLPQEHYPPLALTAQQQKQQTQDAIIAIILETAERQSLLELWEDLHWADPSTLALLGLLIEQAPTASLLMVLTARPEFVPPWPARSHITPITLNRLERPHAEALIARIAGTKPLPEEVVEHIVTKTDGVPLYVEELTKTILVSDVVRDTGERFELTGPLSSLAIPDTLQESLMARLDRLPQVRELAQLSAVLGREFAYEMISGLSTIGETVLQEGLGKLVEAELLYQRGRPPRAKYIFKHALIQDAAYASLLRRPRQQAHLQVAELLEARFPDMVETNPELVAYHYSEANVADRAIDYFQKAGERASRMSANPESIAHLTKGLDVLHDMPDGPERTRRELDLLTTMGPALIATKGYAAAEVESTYRRALELCQEMGDTPQQFSALHGLWFFHYLRAELNDARGLAEQLVELAGEEQDSGLNVAANRSLGYTLLYLGELEAARSRLGRVITLYDPAVHGDYAFRHGGADPGVASLCQGAWAIWALGRPDQSIGQNADGLALSRNLGHPFSETWALTCAAVIHQLRGEPQASQEHAEAALAIANEKGFALYVGWLNILRFWALFEQDGSAEAIAEMRKGIDASQATGASLITPYWLALLASVHGRLGQAEDGLVVTNEALAQVARTSERFCEAELNRLKGELLLQCDAANEMEVEACFLNAIEIARAQGAKSWELRAATSLSRLWQQQGRLGEACELLTPAYTWFTEGFDTVDLKEARSLLDEVEASGLNAMRIE